MVRQQVAQTRIVIVLAFLTLFGLFVSIMTAAGILPLAMAVLSVVVTFAGAIILLMYLPKLHW